MIKFNIIDSVGVITLNRPEKRNALHPKMIKQLRDKFEELKYDTDAKVVILAGEGSSFCAGADLQYLNELKEYSAIENQLDSQNLASLFLDIYKFPKPTIAAVNGPAIAGGCGLASVCDFIVANENSKFGYTEVKIGFIPAIVSIFLIKKIGEGRAKQLLLSGELLSGKRAYEMGLANYYSEDLMKDAFSLADKLKSNSEYSLQLTKNMINKISNLNVEDAVNSCIQLNTISRSSEDFKSGLNNFLNKKKE
jgi:methylglutaconyl-CoA hydratase